jgi:hypothetical protein
MLKLREILHAVEAALGCAPALSLGDVVIIEAPDIQTTLPVAIIHTSP